MSYRFWIEFAVEVRFGRIEEIRKFSDDLRVFLRKYQISKYEHTLEGEHTFTTTYKFARDFDSLDEIRKYVDAVRKFLTERGFKKHSYHITAERVD